MEGHSKSDQRSRSRSRKHGHRPAETTYDTRHKARSRTDRKSKKKKEPDLGPQFKQFKSTKLPRYSKGYHALLSVIKDLKNLREMSYETRETGRQQQTKSQSRQGRRSRSYSRGKLDYTSESDTVPYYRSKSVDRGRSFSRSHEPITNEHDIIYLTYIGRSSRPTSAESRKSRARSRSRRGSGIVQKKVESIPPHRRNSFTFDDLHHRIVEQIQDTYGRSDVDVKQKQFFQTLALIQMEHHKMKKLNMSKSDREFLEKTFEEVKSLKSETNKMLRDANRKYESQYESPSPNKDVRRLTNRKPLDDMFLQRQRTRGRLKLKPLGGNRDLNMERIVSHDFYVRRRNKDWRYDMHKQQSRQYLKFEPNRSTGAQTYRHTSPTRPLKPLIKHPGQQNRLYHHQQPQQRQPPSWVIKKDTYRAAKQQLMYTNKTENAIKNSYTIRESPRTIAMSDTEFRHRMRGAAK